MYDMTIKYIRDEHVNQVSKKHIKELNDCLELVNNDDVCVLFKVKKSKKMNLIKLGCFDGNETMFRVTKTKGCGTHTCTSWDENGKAFSWQFGSSTTCVGDNPTRIREMLVWLIEDELGIKLQY